MAARLNLLGSGIYRNHWGINTNHLQLPVNMEGPTHVPSPIILIIIIITSYDEPSADGIVVDILDCAA